MRHNIKCVVCGSLFDNNNDKAKYCSDNCKAEALKAAKKRWADENKQKCRESAKKYYDSNKDKKRN